MWKRKGCGKSSDGCEWKRILFGFIILAWRGSKSLKSWDIKRERERKKSIMVWAKDKALSCQFGIIVSSTTPLLHYGNRMLPLFSFSSLSPKLKKNNPTSVNKIKHIYLLSAPYFCIWTFMLESTIYSKYKSNLPTFHTYFYSNYFK